MLNCDWFSAHLFLTWPLLLVSVGFQDFSLMHLYRDFDTVVKGAGRVVERCVLNDVNWILQAMFNWLMEKPMPLRERKIVKYFFCCCNSSL